MAQKTKSDSNQPTTFSLEEALSQAYGHWNAGQANEAESLCQRILAHFPGQCDALHLMGLMAFRYRNLPLAAQHMRQACASPRAPAQYFCNLAEICRQNQLFDEAEEAARRAIRINPALVIAWSNLGIVLQDAGKIEESAACLERVASMQPDNPEAHNNLGNTLKLLGQFDRAASHYQRALEIFPQYAAAHCNLGRLYQDLGQLDLAANHTKQAIEIEPRLGNAYLNLASIELMRNRPQEALARINALLSFDPNHVGGQILKARSLAFMNRYVEALDCARQLVILAPKEAEAHNALAEIYQAMSQFPEAEAAFRKAMDLPGVIAEAAGVRLVGLLIDQNRRAEASQLCQALIRKHPKNAELHFKQAALIKFTPQCAELSALEELLASGHLQHKPQQIWLHFALGKAYLDCLDAPRAFNHFARANRLKRDSISFDVAANCQAMTEITQAFSRALLKKFAGLSVASTKPIFLVGMPGSGIKIIENLLAGHSMVHGAGSLPLMQHLAAATNGFPQSIAQISPDLVTQLGQIYLDQVARLAPNHDHIIDATPLNFRYVGLIAMMFSDAKIIHCRRDRADSCLSSYAQLPPFGDEFSFDQEELAQFYLAYEAMMAHWRKILPKSRFIEIDVDAILAAPAKKMPKLLQALDLPWEENCAVLAPEQIDPSMLSGAREYAAHLRPLLNILDAPDAP